MTNDAAATWPLEKAPVLAKTKTLMKGFHWLEWVWRAWEEAARQLSASLGVPICVQGCGLCCTTNTPAAWGIEVSRAASWLAGQPVSVRERILDRIETWLLKPVLEVEPPVEAGHDRLRPFLGRQTAHTMRTPEGTRDILACQRGRCPLLNDDLSCSVHEVRPLACRAWGVTTLAMIWCKRPKGLGEHGDWRAYFHGPGTVELRALVRMLHETIKKDPDLINTPLFATALYAKFREKRLIALTPKIASAKLVSGRDVFWPALFTEKLDGPLDAMPDGELVAL